MKGKPDLTLFVDAGHCGQTNAAGFGAWVKGDERTALTFGGPLNVTARSSNEAELCGIARACHELRHRGYLVPTDKLLMIQCDNTAALGALLKIKGTTINNHAASAAVFPRQNLSDLDKLAISRIKDFVAQTGLQLCVRHVKGHSRGDGRNWVNRECDRLATEGLTAARARLAVQTGSTDRASL